MKSSNKILFVDDEENVLQGYRRALRKQYDLHLALGPEAGLKALEEEGPFAVVVSDYAMPEMNGVELLKRAKQISPNTVRLMLTGYANVDNAIEAINQGSIFRFLTKPCEPEALSRSLDDALEQHRLIMVEKELLEHTLFGSVRVMSQILSLVNPAAFSRTSRIKFYMKHLARELGLASVWRFELAAMLCQLGCITLPADTLSKIFADQPLSEQEREIFRHHPIVAADLLRKIPRLQSISRMIELQQSGFADLDCADNVLPEDVAILGGLMLHVALGFDRLSASRPISTAIRMMRECSGQYHPLIINAMATVEKVEREMEIKLLEVHQIKPFMIADEEVRTKTGVLLMAVGQEVTKPTLQRLSSFSRTVGVQEPVRMRIPM